MVEQHQFESKEALYEALQKTISRDLIDTHEAHGAALLLASGGSSPSPVYRALSADQLPWPKISVALVDERWVDLDHKGSNEALLNNSLLQNAAVDADAYGMKNSAATAKQGWEECEKRYAALPWNDAVALLGMGPDGHTASLFPEAEGLDHALSTSDYVAPLMAKQSVVTGELTERMTLTLTALSKCKTLYLLITGEEKLQVFKRALEDAQGDGPYPLVISHLLASTDINLQVFWAP